MKKITVNLATDSKASRLIKKFEKFSLKTSKLEVEEYLLNEIKIRQRRLKPSIWKKKLSLTSNQS